MLGFAHVWTLEDGLQSFYNSSVPTPFNLSAPWQSRTKPDGRWRPRPDA